MPRLTSNAAPAAAPANAEVVDLDLESIRSEIDGVDDEILHLIQHRQRLASRIGELKEQQGSGLKLRPDREAKVIARQAARVSPVNRKLTVAIWRELMSAGLAVQGEITVHVWSGARRDVREAARTRFGGSAVYRDAATPIDALDAAARDGSVAVLALETDSPWWAELLKRPDLTVFEGIGRRGPLDPAALAVGRVEESALARGIVYRVTAGGGSGAEGRAEKVLGVGEGLRLCVSKEDHGAALDRAHGVVGSTASVG